MGKELDPVSLMIIGFGLFFIGSMTTIMFMESKPLVLALVIGILVSGTALFGSWLFAKVVTRRMI